MQHLDEPIITHLTDTDVYKINMMQLIWEKWRGTPVVNGMNNRTRTVRLAEIIPEQALREQLDHIQSLRFSKPGLDYLEGFRLEDGRPQFKPAFIHEHLATFQLPPYELSKTEDGQYRLLFPGPWERAMLWETLGMSTVNHLRNFYTLQARGLSLADLYEEGRRRLDSKIDLLNGYPFLRFMEFGTRRRFCFGWQDDVVGELKSRLLYGQMTGTSNIWLAMKHDLRPQGTQAHELFMAYMRLFGIDPDAIRASQRKVLEDWFALYGYSLSIALTDTVGSDFFFRMMTELLARLWKGLRQDSGDPFVFGEKAIRFYQQYGIDPLTKLLVFSDGLDLDLMIRLYERFASRIQVAFGWGTNLTNDLGLDPISLVVKLIEILGVGTVKLSDNLEKATGSPEDIAFMRPIFGHSHNNRQACVY